MFCFWTCNLCGSECSDRKCTDAAAPAPESQRDPVHERDFCFWPSVLRKCPLCCVCRLCAGVLLKGEKKVKSSNKVKSEIKLGVLFWFVQSLDILILSMNMWAFTGFNCRLTDCTVFDFHFWQLEDKYIVLSAELPKLFWVLIVFRSVMCCDNFSIVIKNSSTFKVIKSLAIYLLSKF